VIPWGLDTVSGIRDVVVQDLGVGVDSLPDWLPGLGELEATPDNLHVLLRHRLPSIRQAAG